MRRFTNGTDIEFQGLKDNIPDGSLKIFRNVMLPSTCVPDTCRMGFEYTQENGYKLYIDKGISFSGSHEAFRNYLSHGQATFPHWEALVSFLRELGCLFADNPISGQTDAIGNDPWGNELPEAQATAVSEAVIVAARRPIDIDGAQLFTCLASKIVGQDKALRNLTDATQIHFAQLEPKRPETIFMAGPTGVGKTESVRVLVEKLNQQTDANIKLICIDCNLMAESHRISQLIGSPPGYIGFKEPGMLSALANNPRCVILLDEIEKAHPNILKALMSAMDTGKVQLPSPIDGLSELDCRYSMMIFTSNLSLKIDEAKEIGFSNHNEAQTHPLSDEDRCKEALVSAGLNKEIAGRIAWFLEYEPLKEHDVLRVIRLAIDDYANSYGFSVKEISESIINELIQSTGSRFGMRAYKQLINRKFGKAFASRRNATEVTINGNLEALEVESWSEQIPQTLNSEPMSPASKSDGTNQPKNNSDDW